MTKLPKELERKLRSKHGVPLDEFCRMHPKLKPLYDEYLETKAAVEADAAARGMTLAEYLELMKTQ